MAFNEVVNKSAFTSLLKTNLPEYEYTLSSCGGFGKQHLALAYNPKAFKFISQTEDFSFSGPGTKCGSLRPVLLVSLKHLESEQVFTFGVVHLKAGSNSSAMAQRWEQYLKLEKLTTAYKGKNLVLIGDFNTTGYNKKDEDFIKFDEILRVSGFRTSAEDLNCTSYWNGGNQEPDAEHISSVLDHIIVQDELYSSLDDVKVGAHCARLSCRPAKAEQLGLSYQSVSDHCPVQVKFR